MSDNDKHDLFRIVLARLNSGKRKHVWNSIYAAHNGRPDGLLVTADNLWLFRQYRNSVSPSPDHLLDAALAFQAKEVSE